MQSIQQISQPSISFPLEIPTDDPVPGSEIYNWFSHCHGVFHNAILISASLSFVLFLLYQARRSVRKLSYERSYVIIVYYGCLWLVSLLNLAWCSFQEWECTPGKAIQWNVLTLFTTSGMLFLEVSLIAFLLQGDYMNGLGALGWTFAVSALVTGFDILLKAIYVFVFGIPLFIEGMEYSRHIKWNLWIIHRLVLTAVYSFIMFMYHSHWREKLPARPAFYKYIAVMFGLNAVALFACTLSGREAAFGLWLYGAASICYHAFYLPLLYITFLADFFQEDDLHLENVYYSEMKDAGFFDADWD